MILEGIRCFGTRLFARCDGCSVKKVFVMSALISAVASSFLNFPDYQHNLNFLGLGTPQPQSPWVETSRRVILEQIAHPLSLTSAAGRDTGEHAEKLSFRLSMPALGHLLGLDLGKLILLQQFGGVFFLGIVSMLAYRATGDKACAAILPFAFAFCYAGQACFLDMQPFFDGAAYLALGAAMLFSNPFAVFFASTFAFWTDERALLVLPFVLIWKGWSMRDAAPNDWTALFRHAGVWGLVLAVVAYVLCRLWLVEFWGVGTARGGISLSVARQQWPTFLVGLASGLEWLWFIAGLGAVAGYFGGRKWLATVFTFGIIGYLSACAMVYDTTRSIAYAFPAVLVGLQWLARVERTEVLRWYVLGAAALSFLTPSAFIRGNTIEFAAPFFPQALKWFF